MAFSFPLSNTKPNVTIDRPNQNNEHTHHTGIYAFVCCLPLCLPELLSPIKDACHVWMVCVCSLVMPGPSGSSQVNKRMSFDKYTSHPHAHVFQGAEWFIQVNIMDVWKPPMRPNPFILLNPDCMCTYTKSCVHFNIHHHPRFVLAHTHTPVVIPSLLVPATRHHTQHLVIPTTSYHNTQIQTHNPFFTLRAPLPPISNATSLRQH